MIAEKRHHVFLCYNSKDNAAIERIADMLVGEGIDLWMDKQSATAGGIWQEEIGTILQACSSCVVFIGPNGLGDWQQEEIYVAQDRAAKDRDFRLIPVLLPGVADPFSSPYYFLNNRTWVDQRSGISNSQEFQKLVRAIRGSDSVFGDLVPYRPVCPYRGLLRFEERHAEFFCGRDGDVQHLVERLKGLRFLSVIGSSGTGKSSLVRAGLVPALRRGALPNSDTWQIITFTPGPEPVSRLAAKLTDLSSDSSIGELVDGITDDRRTLHHHVLHALSDRPDEEPVVWVIDQFEELFTICHDEKERNHFLDNLLYAASMPGDRNVFVLAMRSDFYHKCRTNPELESRVGTYNFMVSPMGPEGLRRAIEEPASRVGLSLEHGLTEMILSDLSNEPGALPLLEHSLLELWERRSGRLLSLNAYYEIGRVEGSISQRAEGIFGRFNSAQQVVAKRVMLRLIQPGEGTEDTRRQASLTELVTTSDEATIVESVLQELASARLVTMGAHEENGHVLVDISHEALIRGWPRFRSWIDDSRQSLRLHRTLTDSAREWDRLNRDEGTLYRGLRLERALAWRKENESDLNELERIFLDASVARRTAENKVKRRQRALTFISLMTFLLTISALLLLAIVQYRNAARQRDVALTRLSLALAATANSLLEVDPQLSVLLSVEANSAAHTIQAEESLRRSLAQSSVLAVLNGHSGQVLSATFSPDGQKILTASWDKSALVWDANQAIILSSLRGHTDGLSNAEFSPDGRVAITASKDGTARLWNVSTGQELLSLRGTGTGLNHAALSSDGRLIVTAGEDGVARLWDLQTGQIRFELVGHEKWINTASFSPDGKYVVTASGDRTARVWAVATGHEIAKLGEHTNSLLNAAFSRDSKFIVTASEDSTARIWSVGTWRIVFELSGHTKGVTSAVFSPDGKWVATSSKDKTVRVWEAETGRSLIAFRGHGSWVNSVTFSPHGQSVLSASGDSTARLWDAVTPLTKINLKGHTDSVYAASFSFDDNFVVTGSGDGTARIWETGSGRVVAELRGHRDKVLGAAFSPDGRSVATASRDQTARLWDVNTQQTAHELGGHTGAVASVVFSSDGRLVLTASADGTSRVWDSSTGKSLTELRGHQDIVNSASFNHEGTLVVTASRDNTAMLWQVSTGQALALYRHNSAVNNAAFSRDGRYVVTSGGDHICRIWDTQLGQIARELHGHGNWVNTAVFNADGKLILTASGDSTARLWNARTQETLLELRGHSTAVQAAAFSSDGRLLITAGADNIAQIWKCEVCGSVEDLLALASKRVSRKLSPEERERYLYELQGR